MVFLVGPEPKKGLADSAFRRKFFGKFDGTEGLGSVLSNIGTALWQTRIQDVVFTLSQGEWECVRDLVADWSMRSLREVSPFAGLDRQDDVSAIDGLSLILVEHEFDSELLQSVNAKLQKLEENPKTSYSPFVLYPALLRATPGRLSELTQRMRQGLVSANADRACDALTGLYRWMDFSKSFSWLPKVSPDLVLQVGEIIAIRRRGVIARALETAKWIFTDNLDEVREHLIESCNLGLSYLLEEASYESELRGGPNEGYDVALLRRNCVMLALAMQQAGYTTETGVVGWLNVAPKDPLPEVRHLIEQTS